MFADIEPESGLLDPSAADAAITRRTKAVVAVDYAGTPASYDNLAEVAERRGVALVADAAHSLGASAAAGRPAA